MKYFISLLAALLLFSNLPAFACECTVSPLDPGGVLTDFVAENYGKVASFKIDSEHVHQGLSDKIMYLLDGSPKSFGGNCWYLNDVKQPIYGCSSSTKVTYQVTVSLAAETCKQTITVLTTETDKKVKFTPPQCKNN